jgi:light-harvesting complex II chlorophyll a/b binding protein 5
MPVSLFLLMQSDLLLWLQGFAVQSYVTGEGPYANWAKHVSDPFGYNLLTIIGNEDRVPTL